MGKGAIYIDTFSGSLGSIPAKKRRDVAFILAVLKHDPVFSVFDATEHASLADTLTRMRHQGLFDLDNSRGYPWHKAIITEKGEQLLRDTDAAKDAP